MSFCFCIRLKTHSWLKWTDCCHTNILYVVTCGQLRREKKVPGTNTASFIGNQGKGSKNNKTGLHFPLCTQKHTTDSIFHPTEHQTAMTTNPTTESWHFYQLSLLWVHAHTHTLTHTHTHTHTHQHIIIMHTIESTDTIFNKFKLEETKNGKVGMNILKFAQREVEGKGQM